MAHLGLGSMLAVEEERRERAGWVLGFVIFILESRRVRGEMGEGVLLSAIDME